MLRRITLYYTLAITLCFKGFCKRLYMWSIYFLENDHTWSISAKYFNALNQV